MASNDPETQPDAPAPAEGPVAFLTRIVHVPAENEQTPVRMLCLLALALVLATTPVPWNAVGFAALVILALSLGRINPKA